MAEDYPTRGKVLGGFVTGLFSGLLGTGIGYFIVGRGDILGLLIQSWEYQNSFAKGWDKKTRSRKRNAFLGGGVLGTMAFLAFFVYR